MVQGLNLKILNLVPYTRGFRFKFVALGYEICFRALRNVGFRV